MASGFTFGYQLTNAALVITINLPRNPIIVLVLFVSAAFLFVFRIYAVELTKGLLKGRMDFSAHQREKRKLDAQRRVLGFRERELAARADMMATVILHRNRLHETNLMLAGQLVEARRTIDDLGRELIEGREMQARLRSVVGVPPPDGSMAKRRDILRLEIPALFD